MPALPSPSRPVHLEMLKMPRVTTASDERTLAVTLIAMTIDRIASTILSWIGTENLDRRHGGEMH